MYRAGCNNQRNAHCQHVKTTHVRTSQLCFERKLQHEVQQKTRAWCGAWLWGGTGRPLGAQSHPKAAMRAKLESSLQEQCATCSSKNVFWATRAAQSKPKASPQFPQMLPSLKKPV